MKTRADFMATADSRRTDSEVMGAIWRLAAQVEGVEIDGWDEPSDADNAIVFERAEQIWTDGYIAADSWGDASACAVTVWDMASGNGRDDPNETLMWGDMPASEWVQRGN